MKVGKDREDELRRILREECDREVSQLKAEYDSYIGLLEQKLARTKTQGTKFVVRQAIAWAILWRSLGFYRLKDLRHSVSNCSTFLCMTFSKALSKL